MLPTSLSKTKFLLNPSFVSSLLRLSQRGENAFENKRMVAEKKFDGNKGLTTLGSLMRLLI